MEPPSEPESEPQPLAEASAAAPLRAAEVARLREEQQKVTGRAWFRPSAASACGRDSGQPLTRPALRVGPESSRASCAASGLRAPRGKLLSRAFVVFCL